MIETIPENMRIFYAGCQYDHYDSKRGFSFEYENFFSSLSAYPGVTVTYFPFERILEVGRKKFGDELIELVQRDKPDALFVLPYSDELEPAILEALRKYTKTIAWFADDSWRFYNYSKFWAKHFSWVVTTYSYMPPLYVRAGQPNVIRSQWAADTKAYYPMESRPEFGPSPDVSFVGGWSRPRERIISRLASKGISVATYGGGWKGGRISAEKRNYLFSSSKISLGLNPAPGFWNVNSLGRLVARPSLNRVVPDFHFASNVTSWLHRGVPQVKARHFEIPACGGFMLAGHADDLEKFYTPGKEIAFYEDLDDLVKKIRYYLTHDNERSALARAAYERTLRDHTYQKRFEAIFQKIFS